MNPYWSEVVNRLTPYVPGEQPKVANLIKLNTNENPYGPSPKVLAALADQANDDLRLYPDPNADQLKTALATYYAVRTEQVFVGNGSDEVLAHTFQGLLKHDEPLLFPDISYSFYPVYCGLYGVESERIPLGDEFEICVEDYDRPNGGIIFPNPNAPTGRVLSIDAIESLLKINTQSVVVVDEAYIDFGGESAVKLIDRYPNLLVIQTFSKSRSLAGLRVGFAMGDKGLIEALERVKNSFNSYPLDRFAIAGGIAAIEDAAYFSASRQKIIASREALVTDLIDLGFDVLPSAANFVFTTHKRRDASELCGLLREQGIIVRHFRQERIDQYLRITVGTPEECERLLEALRGIVKNQ